MTVIKILLKDVYVRHGICLICPENLIVLGGSVERLQKAKAFAERQFLKERGSLC